MTFEANSRIFEISECYRVSVTNNNLLEKSQDINIALTYLLYFTLILKFEHVKQNSGDYLVSLKIACETPIYNRHLPYHLPQRVLLNTLIRIAAPFKIIQLLNAKQHFLRIKFLS